MGDPVKIIPKKGLGVSAKDLDGLLTAYAAVEILINSEKEGLIDHYVYEFLIRRPELTDRHEVAHGAFKSALHVILCNLHAAAKASYNAAAKASLNHPNNQKSEKANDKISG
jgi:hypothetical protein